MKEKQADIIEAVWETKVDIEKKSKITIQGKIISTLCQGIREN